MEGVVELEHQGRHITIQRTSTTAKPFSVFRAYDSVTGEDIPQLTGENCGLMLLGVERSVFLRSAFIGQNASFVDVSAELEQRLSRLVSTGEESVSYSETEKRLRTWKNHIRHNTTGQLPQLEQELRKTEDALAAIHRYHTEDLDLFAQRQNLVKRDEELAYVEENLVAEENMKKGQRLEQVKADLASAQAREELAQNAVSSLPSKETLEKLVQEERSLPLREEFLATMAPADAPPMPTGATPFRGLSAVEATDFATRNVQKIQPLPKKMNKIPLLLPAILLAVGGVALLFLVPLLGVILMAVAGALIAVCGALSARNQAQRESVEKENAEILQKFGVNSAEEILSAALQYGELWQVYQRELAQYNAKKTAYDQQKQQLEESRQGLLSAVRAFAPSIYTTKDASAALQNALGAWDEAEKASSARRMAEETCRMVQETVGEKAHSAAPKEIFSQQYSLDDVARQRQDLKLQLHEVETVLARHHGQVQSLGDPAALEAEREEHTERKAKLEQYYNAYALAMETLDAANSEMQSRFAPDLSKRAGELFSRMTGGNYDGVRLLHDLTMEVRPAGGAVSRSQLSLSSGTGEQLYLALRLAMCEKLLGETAPMVLDDALVFFDDARMAQALCLLKEESAHRQILLFTCQTREKEWLRNQ
jgi:Na+-transporting methylmalonyl-CoA/oxaloacetate decarboxylase gamma subunit